MGISSPEKFIDTFTTQIHKMLEKEVEKAIKKEIMPKIEKQIKQHAQDAVKLWAVRTNVMQDHTGLDRIIKVQVQFVEEIYNQTVIEEVIKMEVKDDKH